MEIGYLIGFSENYMVSQIIQGVVVRACLGWTVQGLIYLTILSHQFHIRRESSIEQVL